MTTKNKKLIEELKHYNDELEKHISGVDVDLVSKSLRQSTSGQENKEFQVIFSQNLIDLRTEVSLLRKNLSVDIENMVMKVVNGQQNQFTEKMNNLFLQTTFEMKTYLSETLVSFGEEMSNIKKSYNEMTIQNSNLNSEISKLSDEISFLKSQIHTQDSKSSFIELQRKLDDVNNLLELNMKLVNNKDKQLSSNLSILSNSFESLTNQNKLLESAVKMSQKTIPSPKLVQTVIKTPKKLELKSIKQPKKEIPVKIIPKSKVKVVTPEIDLGLEEPTKVPSKILDIESRLNKLNLLK